jgi:2-polyprenyl-3-methyl-5-hydroxy-6-metoxy-1,4-benzoquinol methylase
MRIIRNFKNKTIDRMFPNWAYGHKKSSWQTSWSRSKYAPTWRISEIPKEVQEVVEKKWFSPGDSVLDIGCGSGEIAAWLAEREFKVLGVDYAAAAIDIANEQYANSDDNLTFEAIDICQPAAIHSKFQSLIDRGCLHGIPEVYAPVYVENVASYCVPGAKFLLLFATNKGPRQKTVEEDRKRKSGKIFIEKLFQGKFNILSVEPMLFIRGTSDPASGIAVRMERNEA